MIKYGTIKVDNFDMIVLKLRYRAKMAITKTRNGESGKGIEEWGMGNGE